MKPIPLPAHRIKEFDELSLDKITAETTLKVALTYHANTLNEITRKERKVWAELGVEHDLDLYNTKYQLSSVNGAVSIVEVTEGEDDETH